MASEASRASGFALVSEPWQADARRAIDVSVTVRPRMPIYTGDPAVAFELAKSIARGDPANVSRLDLGAHTGTHVDAPRHFIPDGEAASELPLEPFIGPCVVADASAASETLDGNVIGSLELPPNTSRLLLKTTNSALWEREVFVPDFIRVDFEGANALLDRGLRMVGMDYVSIGDVAAHLLLLGAGVGVLEGLDLRDVDPGPYFIVCLPLKFADSDGAPARALLWPLED